MHKQTIRGYTTLICEFASFVRNCHKKDDIPFCHPFTDMFWTVLRRNGPKHVSGVFSNLCNLPPERFMQVQYLFFLVCPVGHATVLVISPRNKTIELLDSHWSRSDLDKAYAVYRDAIDMLATHLGHAFIPLQWKMRMCQSADQGSTLYCATFTVTNIALLAFGYGPYDFGRENILDRIERLCLDFANRGFGRVLSGDIVHDESVYDLDFTWNEGQNSSKWWRPLDRDNIMNHLPESLQARTGVYDHMTETELTDHVLQSGNKYQGSPNPYPDFLAFRDFVKLRDFHVKTHKYKVISSFLLRLFFLDPMRVV